VKSHLRVDSVLETPDCQILRRDLLKISSFSLNSAMIAAAGPTTQLMMLQASLFFSSLLHFAANQSGLQRPRADRSTLLPLC
jgi:hypothetical protein